MWKISAWNKNKAQKRALHSYFIYIYILIHTYTSIMNVEAPCTFDAWMYAWEYVTQWIYANFTQTNTTTHILLTYRVITERHLIKIAANTELLGDHKI